MSDIFKNSYTFRLFKREPSFIEGISALIDNTPRSLEYRQDKTPEEADFNSLHADWEAIGGDLKDVIEKYGKGSFAQ